MHGKLRRGGLLVVTMRDFDKALTEKPPMGHRSLSPGRRVASLSVRTTGTRTGGPCYTVRYLVLRESEGGWELAERTTRHRAIRCDELSAAARAAGFSDIAWPTERTVVEGSRS
jgi:hypothetical protein